MLAELLGHTAIIYHVAATGSGVIASGTYGVRLAVEVVGNRLLR